tara:strand:+ start:370 stop:2796 length:2427 start_codon:yes stop_codon:yes gene_type:complete
MIVSLAELSKVLNKKLKIEDVSESLTMMGLEVESVAEATISILDQNIVVGSIKSIQKHPNADKLQVCLVDSGSEVLTVVCGAANIKAGDKVPLAQIGTKFGKSDKFPDGLKIKKTTIRDIESYGMLCSSSELGLGYEFEDGIFILPSEFKTGKQFNKIESLSDYLLDVSITPNRGDCLSVFGICRELAAGLDCSFTSPMFESNYDGKRVDSLQGISVTLESNKIYRYALKKIENVKLKSSPFWLKNFLAKMNISSINNIVDASNFFMITTGHPIHVFDFDQIKGASISVTTSSNTEIETLTNEVKKTEGHLAVCDEKGPLALAGIVGGKRGSVTSKTKNILIECASFDPAQIRSSSKSLNISSESSFRFERHVSEYSIKDALFYAADLIQSICEGDIVKDYLDTNPNLQNLRTVDLSIGKVSKILGAQIDKQEIVEILESLSINRTSIEKDSSDKITFAVPDYRFDISSEHDLIEEVLRVRGFDSIDPVLPKVSIREKLSSPVVDLRVLTSKARASFAQDGYSEVVNFSFTDDLILEDLEKIEILNPLSNDSKFLRSSLIPSLLKNAAYNFNHGNDRFKLFEIGNVFSGSSSKITQNMQLAALCSIEPKNLMWDKNGFDFYDKKRSLEQFFDFVDIESKSISFRSSSKSIYASLLHPGKSAFLYRNEEEVGFLGEIHPEILALYNIKKELLVSKLFLDKISKLETKNKNLSPFGTHPLVQRDISLLINKDIEAMEVIELINKFNSTLIKEAFIFDVFEDSKIGPDKKSLSISLLFGANDRTLEDKEVSDEMNEILLKVQKEIPMEIRE